MLSIWRIIRWYIYHQKKDNAYKVKGKKYNVAVVAIARELANLMEIKDHYHKYVVTKDNLANGNINEIEIMHIADFLLKAEY